jgi:hypothetical protein
LARILRGRFDVFDRDAYAAWLRLDTGADPTTPGDEAASTLESLRQDVRRLEKEVAVTTSIAREIFQALATVAPRRADLVHEDLRAQYERYQRDASYPNVEELFVALAKRPKSRIESALPTSTV